MMCVVRLMPDARRSSKRSAWHADAGAVAAPNVWCPNDRRVKLPAQLARRSYCRHIACEESGREAMARRSFGGSLVLPSLPVKGTEISACYDDESFAGRRGEPITSNRTMPEPPAHKPVGAGAKLAGQRGAAAGQTPGMGFPYPGYDGTSRRDAAFAASSGAAGVFVAPVASKRPITA
jgi:hypothetical protein